jgi:hypothetical protein
VVEVVVVAAVGAIVVVVCDVVDGVTVGACDGAGVDASPEPEPEPTSNLVRDSKTVSVSGSKFPRSASDIEISVVLTNVSCVAAATIAQNTTRVAILVLMRQKIVP